MRRLDRLSFVLGMVAALFAIIVIFVISMIVFGGLIQFPLQETLIFTIFAIILISIFMEVGMFIYYMTSLKPSSSSGIDLLKEKEIRLSGIESAKKETQKRYYERSLSEETYKKMMEDFERESATLRHEISGIKKQIGTTE